MNIYFKNNDGRIEKISGRLAELLHYLETLGSKGATPLEASRSNYGFYNISQYCSLLKTKHQIAIPSIRETHKRIDGRKSCFKRYFFPNDLQILD